MTTEAGEGQIPTEPTHTPHSMVTVAELNAATEADARAMLRACADVPRWVEELVRRRPYDDVADLVRVATELADDWRPEEVTAALAQHPRIGERRAGQDVDARLSEREQSSVGAGDDLAERLRAGNVAYEGRFGRVFLVRAAGRTGEEILDQLQRRLTNDEDTEFEETTQQLREIALLRLQGLVVGLAVGPVVP